MLREVRGFVCLVVALGFILRILSEGPLEKSYWNSHFDYSKSLDLRKQAILETDLFRCDSFVSEGTPEKISWKCKTKVSGVIWIPNRQVFHDKRRLLVSFTDSLGILYAFPYSKRKLLSLCTSANIDTFGEVNESGMSILPKDYVFVAINNCLNL
ncbi:hypothetical protein HWI79_3402 [Cryptosporidium felis]|nr:hypothetical protein HWI79_3402 [Cryptosporidium felis]